MTEKSSRPVREEGVGKGLQAPRQRPTSPAISSPAATRIRVAAKNRPAGPDLDHGTMGSSCHAALPARRFQVAELSAFEGWMTGTFGYSDVF
jgi:hypothetical protein